MLGHANKKIELEKINNQIQALQLSLNQEKNQQATLQQELKINEIKTILLNQQINKFNQSISKEQHQLNELKRKQDIFNTHLENQRTAYLQQMLLLYRLKQSQSIKIILHQQNPSTINRYLYYYHYLNVAHAQSISSIKQTLLMLADNMHDIEEHQAKLKNLLQQKQQQQKLEKTSLADRQKLILHLNQDAASKQQELTQLFVSQKELSSMFSRFQIQESAWLPDKAFEQARGKLIWPVHGKIFASYGSMLDVGQRNSGVMIKALENTPVHAIYTGKVIFANWLRGFGLLVIINHGNGYMSLYARNHAITTAVGKQVNKGDIIATVGNSGGFNKPSLYFEIRHNGLPVNPKIWCG